MAEGYYQGFSWLIDMAQSASSGQGPFTFPYIFCPPISPCFRPFCRLHCVQQLRYAFAPFSRPAACTCVSLDAVRTLSSFCKTSMSASFRLASGSFGTMLKASSHSRYISWAVSFTFGCVYGFLFYVPDLPACTGADDTGPGQAMGPAVPG